MWARFDDFRAGRALRFPEAQDVLAATSPDEVADVLRAADDATREGRWAFGFVTYEAGRALAGEQVSTAPGLPLAWFGLGAAPSEVPLVAPGGGGYTVGPWTTDVDRTVHADRVDLIRNHIAAGDVYQVNLTSRWWADAAGDLVPLYADLAARQRGAHNAFVDAGRFAVLSASPELFVEWRGDEAVMRPMKGTAPRGRDLDEDEQIVAALRASEKDRAENIMIVDLVRNDLARVAATGTVEARSLCAVERFGTVHQLTSEVAARLRPGVDVVALFSALFPSGSVTGAPKRRAMAVIDEVEPEPRGIYCGAVGFLAPPEARVRARFNVAIRTVLVDRESGRATYGSGGGITWSSDPETEYEELLTKTRVLASSPAEPALLETMRCAGGGSVPRLDRHLRRLAASARYLGYAFDEGITRSAIATALAAGGAHRVRLTLDRGGAVTVTLADLPTAAQVPVGLAVDDRPVDRTDRWLRHKTTDRRVYDERRARWPGVDDVVLVNAEGEVTETTIANILVRTEGSWWTPPLDVGCLPGVERGALLDAGEIHERVITVDDLRAAEAIEVVNALRGRRPAVLRTDAVRS